MRLTWSSTTAAPLLGAHSAFYLNSAMAKDLLGKVLSPKALDMLGRLEHFEELPVNWDSYGASVPQASTIQRARALVEHLDQADVPPYFTSPGPNGEVMVEYRLSDNVEAEFHYAEEGDDLLVMRGDKVLYEGPLDMNEFWQYVRIRRAM